MKLAELEVRANKVMLERLSKTLQRGKYTFSASDFDSINAAIEQRKVWLFDARRALERDKRVLKRYGVLSYPNRSRAKSTQP